MSQGCAITKPSSTNAGSGAPGLTFLGGIPDSWVTRRLKYVASCNDEVLAEDTDPNFNLLYVDIGNVDQDSGILKKEPLSFEDAPSRARRRVRHGDVIVSTVRTYLRAIAPIVDPEANLVVSTGFAVIRPKKNLDPNFAAYALRAPYFVDAVVARSAGVSYPAINASDLVALPIALPPLDQQRAIVTFLDHETARIDALIEKKHRQLALLGDKRASLINGAFVSEAGSKSKRSGNRAIEGIPDNWEVLPMRRVVRSIEQGWSPVAEDRITEESEWCVLKLSAISRGEFRPNEHKGLPAGVEPDMRYEVHAGDLLITRSNTPDMVGDVCVVPQVRPRLMMSDLIYRVRLDERRCLQRFACYWLISRSGRASIEADARGTSGSMVKISQEHIRSWPIPLPPIALQHKVVNDLDRRLSGIKALAETIHRSVELLHEYRLALVSAAVTGKTKITEGVAA